MAYLGREPEFGAFERQTLTADGSTTTFTLNYTVGSSSSILVSVAGVVQDPTGAYAISGGGTSIFIIDNKEYKIDKEGKAKVAY